MKNENEQEHVITAKDVFDTVAGIFVFFLAVVAILSVIWANWLVLKFALTLIVVVLVISIVWWWVGDKIEKLRK